MTSLENQTLSDDDLLIVVLSGCGEGRYRNLKEKLARVFYEEEHPSPKKVKKGDSELIEEVEPHKLIQGRFFTDILRMPSKSFQAAWLTLSQYQNIEPVGFGGDYLVYSRINQEADEIRKRFTISEEDYAYLTSLGQRVRSA